MIRKQIDELQDRIAAYGQLREDAGKKQQMVDAGIPDKPVWQSDAAETRTKASHAYREISEILSAAEVPNFINPQDDITVEYFENDGRVAWVRAKDILKGLLENHTVAEVLHFVETYDDSKTPLGMLRKRIVALCENPPKSNDDLHEEFDRLILEYVNDPTITELYRKQSFTYSY